MGIDPLTFYVLKFVLDGKFLPHVFEFINFQGLHQTVQALRGKMERVDKLEATHSD